MIQDETPTQNEPDTPAEPVAEVAEESPIRMIVANRLIELRSKVLDAKAEMDEAAEAHKMAKKQYDATRENFERQFDDLINADKVPGLPFDGVHQSDVNEDAANRPDVQELVSRLSTLAGIEIAPLVVAGFTDDETAQARAYCEALESYQAQKRAGLPVSDLPPYPSAPAFLAEDSEE
jgi:hypothetical protein